MRPKARGLAQYGGPPVWLEESDPAGCDFECDGWSMTPDLSDHITCPVPKFIVPDSGIGLSYRPASLCSLAGRYDNHMPESTISPSQ